MLKYHSLRDKVFSLKNLYAAFQQVKKNKGKAGLDRVSMKQFESDLENNIQNIHKELKTEISQPSPVLRVYIPKGKHDKRPLGIPMVKDRVVQQAFRQIIEPIFEKDFSDNSFGFCPERCCHDAIKRLELYKQDGYRYILDADIKAFYDTIPHKLIMNRLREKIADGWVLNGIENMPKAGVMEDGIVHETNQGTPQGGVISPLLANLVGDIIDKELEKAGYKFVRYADDFVVMTKTKVEFPAAFKRGFDASSFRESGELTTNVSRYTDSSKRDYSHLKENILMRVQRHDKVLFSDLEQRYGVANYEKNVRFKRDTLLRCP